MLLRPYRLFRLCFVVVTGFVLFSFFFVAPHEKEGDSLPHRTACPGSTSFQRRSLTHRAVIFESHRTAKKAGAGWQSVSQAAGVVAQIYARTRKHCYAFKHKPPPPPVCARARPRARRVFCAGHTFGAFAVVRRLRFARRFEVALERPLRFERLDSGLPVCGGIRGGVEILCKSCCAVVLGWLSYCAVASCRTCGRAANSIY